MTNKVKLGLIVAAALIIGARFRKTIQDLPVVGKLAGDKATG